MAAAHASANESLALYAFASYKDSFKLPQSGLLLSEMCPQFAGM